MSTSEFDAIVIGAGQAGLAAAYHLQRAGLRFCIVEAGQGTAGSWSAYYRSLKLFSPARFSSLPGLPFPGDPARYPTRDETIDYLSGYAAHFGFPVSFGFRVQAVTRRQDGRFEVLAADGRQWVAQAVIVASGAFHQPHWPEIEGQSLYRGTLLHSMHYDAPSRFQGQRVVVVGAANSAVQIGAELSSVADVTLAARRPPRLISQRVVGQDVHFWWWLFGLDSAAPSTWRGRIFKWLHAGHGPSVLDHGGYRQALARQKPALRPMFQRFTSSGVVWADGSTENVDAVVFATGFKPNLGFLGALGALDARGAPRQTAGISSTVTGLYYVGLSYQRTFASATLRGVGPDAAHVVRALARGLPGRTAPHLPDPLPAAS